MFSLCAMSNLSTTSNILFSSQNAFFSSPPRFSSFLCLSNKQLFHLFTFCTNFSSSLFLFYFLIIHLLLSPPPMGKELPLSQAKTINQSSVRTRFTSTFLLLTLLLHSSPPLCTSPFAFNVPFYRYFHIILSFMFYGLICFPLSFSLSSALFDPLSRPLHPVLKFLWTVSLCSCNRHLTPFLT